jgi:transposase-like protein
MYAAPTEDIALIELGLLDDKMGVKYPKTTKIWKDNRANLLT